MRMMVLGRFISSMDQLMDLNQKKLHRQPHRYVAVQKVVKEIEKCGTCCMEMH